MKIQNYQINTKNTISFSSFYQPVQKLKSGPIVTNNTCFFRLDFSWKEFIAQIAKRYDKAQKVNIYSFACSNGAEPFSIAMMLMNRLGEKAKIFLPIKASDIDEKILEAPRKGKIYLEKIDISEIKSHIGADYSDFIKHDDNFKFIPDYNKHKKICEGEVTQKLKNAVEFEQRDITRKLPDISKENTIIFARNFWPYLSQQNQNNLAKNLSDNIGGNSLIFLGGYDCNYITAPKLLRENGFVNYSDLKACFKKQT